MASPPKIFVEGQVLFITTSVKEGILLPANTLTNLLLLACLARAHSLHNVTITDFVVERTHVHMVLVVSNPDDVRGFMERFKT